MSKLKYILCLLLLGIAFFSCQKDPDPTLEISTQTLSWKYSDTVAQSVTVTANYSWKAALASAEQMEKWKLVVDKDHFSIAPVAPNTNPSDLYATVTVSSRNLSKTIVCKQDLKPESYFGVTPLEYTWQYNETDARAIKVTSNYDWTATIPEADKESWNFVPDTDKVTVSPKAENKTKYRLATTVTITSDTKTQKVKIVQEAAPATLSLSPSSLFWTSGDTLAKTVTVSSSYEWKASIADADLNKWKLETAADGKSFSIVPKTVNAGTESVSTNVIVSTSSLDKTLTWKVACTQAAGSACLNVTPTSISWKDTETDARKVTVSANYDWTADIVEGEKWLWALNIDKANGCFTIAPKIANTGTTKLTAKVRVESEGMSKDVECVQTSKEPYLDIKAENLSWKRSETDARTVEVLANYDWQVSLPKADEALWSITLGPDGKYFTIAPKSENESPEVRVTTATVTSSGLSKTIVCTQDYKPELFFEISESDLFWECSSKAPKMVAVTSNYEWTASLPDSDKDKWEIVISSDSKYFVVAPKTENSAFTPVRTIVTVCSEGVEKKVVCTQGAVQAYLEVSPLWLSWDFEETAAKSVSVNANYEWSVKLPSGDADKWSLVKAADGKSFTVAPRSENLNPTVKSTVVTVIVESPAKTITVTVSCTQDEVGSYLRLNPEQLDWQDKETNAKTVTVNANYPWQASLADTDNWALILASDLKSFTVAPKNINTSTTAKSTMVTVTVSGPDRTVTKTVSCTQAAVEPYLKVNPEELVWSAWDMSDREVMVDSNYLWNILLDSNATYWRLQYSYGSTFFTVGPTMVGLPNSHTTYVTITNEGGLSLTVLCTQQGLIPE